MSTAVQRPTLHTWFPVAALVLLLAACGEENPAPAPVEAFTFTEMQIGVFDKTCAFNGCHGAARAGGLELVSGKAYDQLVGQEPKNAKAADAGMLRVDAKAPDNSFLLHKLNGPAGGMGDRMPPSSPKMSERTIEAIRMWIEAGAPNN